MGTGRVQEREGRHHRQQRRCGQPHTTAVHPCAARTGERERRTATHVTHPRCVRCVPAAIGGKATVLVSPLASITPHPHATLPLRHAHRVHPTAALRTCRHGNAAHAHAPFGTRIRIHIVYTYTCVYSVPLDMPCSGDRCASRTRTDTHARREEPMKQAQSINRPWLRKRGANAPGRRPARSAGMCMHASAVRTQRTHKLQGGAHARHMTQQPRTTVKAQAKHLPRGRRKQSSGRYR